MSFLRGTRADCERMECALSARMRRRAGLAMTCAAGTILSHSGRAQRPKKLWSAHSKEFLPFAGA